MPAPDAGPAWAERPSLLPLVAGIAVIATAAGALAATGAGDPAALAFVGGLAWLVLLLPLVLGRRRYESVAIDGPVLRVGRERLTIADLDADLLEAQAGRPVASFPRFPAERGFPVVGGAFEPTFGRRHLRIAPVQDATSSRGVPTRDPPGLARALLAARAGNADRGFARGAGR